MNEQLKTSSSSSGQEAADHEEVLVNILEIVAERPSHNVLAVLSHGPGSALELRRDLAGISEAVLSRSLSQLSRAGLITHIVRPDASLRVVFSLTTTGRSLLPVLLALAVWEKEHSEGRLTRET
ncbi:winged helix-turn-helix transcriptional regulator [Kineococcus sp. GCM10028916]|uniref:winged helix-turn-helix transcriptional regulator n=1 Tax=Kineococcus sp. GCM10028916 TaxID=3273394 RepID=UPI00362F6E48